MNGTRKNRAPARPIPGRRHLLHPSARAIGIVSLTVAATTACSDGSAAGVRQGGPVTPPQAAPGNPAPAPTAPGPAAPQSAILEQVQRIIVEHLGVEASRVTPQARIIEDLGGDSLDVVELVMATEEAFGVEIPDDAAKRLATVGDFAAYVQAHAVPAGTPPRRP